MPTTTVDLPSVDTSSHAWKPRRFSSSQTFSTVLSGGSSRGQKFGAPRGVSNIGLCFAKLPGGHHGRSLSPTTYDRQLHAGSGQLVTRKSPARMFGNTWSRNRVA